MDSRKMFLGVFLLCCSAVVAGAFQCATKGKARRDEDVLQVHLVPHTHDDVGWLKTVDEYYYGANNSIQNAGVQYILDTVIPELVGDPQKRFIYVEIAFFQRWWRQQTPQMQSTVIELVRRGQLEFINGGWCMNDEASTHYNAIIDQMTLGLKFITDNFGEAARPRIAWHIDPFGHSAAQASLFAQMSFEGFFFSRIHYADMKKRTDEQRMELLWQGSKSLGKASQIFTGVLYHGYGPPAGFCFDMLCNNQPIQDDPRLYDYNVAERVSSFVNLTCEQAKHYQSGHIMLTMGEDFNYQNAHVWFKNLDKLIKYVNTDDRVNIFYSTPSKYVDAIKDRIQLELKTDDFFPYADEQHSYWTGYFTSRPALKGYVRRNNNLLQVCKQVEVLGRETHTASTSQKLREAMGVAQHHDAVSGTEKQHVANDYAKRLAIGAAECQNVVASFLDRHTDSLLHDGGASYTFCDYLNISACAVTENARFFSVVLYNPLAKAVDSHIRVPINSASAVVYAPNGKTTNSAVLPVSKATAAVRGNLGNAMYELVFTARSLPPLGVAVYHVNVTNGASSVNGRESDPDHVVIKNDHVRLAFSRDSGRLVKYENLDANLSRAVEQQFFWYNASTGNAESKQASGAYIFRPNSSTVFPVSPGNRATLSVFVTDVLQEVRQVFSPWLSQVVRLYDGALYAEFEYTVGPIADAPQPNLGKEVVSRFDTDMRTSGVFYTDANGREMQRRVRNYRPTWTYADTEPVAANYYPVNSRAYLRDPQGGDQFTVLTDRSLGASSLRDGSLEIMVHRRLLFNDKRGVNEALNEPGRTGKGLVVRGRFLVMLEPHRSAAVHRAVGEQEMLRPAIAFTPDAVSSTYGGLTRALPYNVHLLTLERFGRVVLIRLEHQFAVDEDAQQSLPVKVQLAGLFTDFNIVAMTELNLSANKELGKRQKRRSLLRHILENTVEPLGTDFEVELAPMQIRTFKLDIEWN